VALALMVAGLLLPQPIFAQDAASSAAPAAAAADTAVAGMPALPPDAPTAEQVTAGLAVWKDRGGCYNCHGDFAQGGTGGHFPAGPSLRKTHLDLETIRDTISCGLPGTPMPYNLAGAYTAVSCYGNDLGPAPSGAVPGAGLKPEEITDLLAYLKADIIGKLRITKAECVEYYGDPNAPNCAAYH